jgi:putative ABC transport system permease protein
MTALADLRRAMRSLVRRPWFTGAAIASLAFGIGANATVFTIVNALLFRPLPYPDSDRLVLVDRVR